jgi:D-sedoheptulose 7-phosphate isomerase
MSYTKEFLQESVEILNKLDSVEIDKVAKVLLDTRNKKGRLFFAGSGGGAGHSSHATADFRKLGGFEAYSITDNVSELTARVNDESWETSYSNWLKVSRFNKNDCLFVFSVGGGSSEMNISPNLVSAVDLARECGASVVGVVGRDGGHLKKYSTACILIPTINSSHVTTQVEGFQALMWHLLIGHPVLDAATPKWESEVNP